MQSMWPDTLCASWISMYAPDNHRGNSSESRGDFGIQSVNQNLNFESLLIIFEESSETMKQLILSVPENKYKFINELLKSLRFVKIEKKQHLLKLRYCKASNRE